MPANLPIHAPRLVLLAASASLLMIGAANAQAWGGYPPPGAYGGYAPYAQSPYAPGPYAQSPYDQGPYAQGAYAQGPYAAPYDPYAAQRRAWRRRQAQQQQAQPYPTEAASPASDAAATAPPPPAVAANAAPVAAAASVSTPQSVAPQSAALAHKVVESASAYLAYMKKASDIHDTFADGAAVAKEVRTGAGYEAKQFEEGAIAYAAIVALQEPGFVEGVRAAGGGDPGRAQQIAADLIANPAAASTFQGADAAAARAGAALRRQGDRLLEAGAKVKQAAYDVQHSAWSKDDVPNPEVRLAAAKSLSATRLTPAREETDKLLKRVLAEQGSPPAYGASSPVVSRGLALAALAVLGQAGEENADRVAPLLTEDRGGECLKMAKLNLFQCLAVAGPHYEDVFCLGQHAMMDTAQCVIRASGVSQPVMTASAAATEAPTPAQPAQVSPAPQDYWVPLGGGSAQGSGEAARK
jgi:hypothetical protein